MSIMVKCPNGHRLKIKDHWAGKSGRCPRCRAKIHVPEISMSLSDDDVLKMIGDYREPKKKKPKPIEQTVEKDDDEHVLDEFDVALQTEASGLSLIRSRLVHHKKTCKKCGITSDLWFAKCDHCGEYFDN